MAAAAERAAAAVAELVAAAAVAGVLEAWVALGAD